VQACPHTSKNKRLSLKERLTPLFQNVAIRHKLVLIIMGTCMVALFLTGAVFIGFQHMQTRREMVKTLRTHAEIMGENCKASLAFEDTVDAEDILKSFRVESSILVACVNDKDKKVFAIYQREDANVDPTLVYTRYQKSYVFEKDYLAVSHPIVHEGDYMGSVTVWSDLDPLQAMFQRNTLIISGVLVLASLVAYLVSSRVQGVISTPILSLAEVVKTVSEKKSYSTRATKHSNDEVGILIDAFNDMLGQIQQRDAALVRSNEQLEARVEERTGELKSANEQLTREIACRNQAEEAERGRTERIIAHQTSLLKLGKSTHHNLQDTFVAMSEEIAQTLTVERMSVWLFDEAQENLVCRDLFTLSNRTHTSDLCLSVDDYPKYFQAIEVSRILAVDDAFSDPRTSEFASGYLQSNGVVSILDVPIRIHGRCMGVLCHEQVGDQREWTLEEQDFARTIADMIVLMLETEKRKRSEEAIQELNRTLEAHVQELKRSNAELQDFAYVTAHDLKAPLRGIGTLTDWMVSDYHDVLDEEGREHMQLLKGRVSRMDELINSILRYSEIGTSHRNIQKINVDTLVSETIGIVDPPDTFEMIIEDQLPFVVCERVRLHQVFQNLIDNAVKHMDKPNGRIEIGCGADGEFWRFHVADNGPGIEAKYHERIFRMFQTLVPRDELESIGIGLTVVKKIVELYGGHVGLESEPGQGTTFFFTFPMMKTVVSESESYVRSE
jgi:signal transduction histidine kinase